MRKSVTRRSICDAGALHGVNGMVHYTIVGLHHIIALHRGLVSLESGIASLYLDIATLH